MSIRDHLLALSDIKEVEQLPLINTSIHFIELKNDLVVYLLKWVNLLLYILLLLNFLY